MQRHQSELGTGYSIRMGNTVPVTGANLGYIGYAQDRAQTAFVNISNNTPYYETHPHGMECYPYTDGSLIGSAHDGFVYSNNVLVTNIFTNDTDRIPLYYRHTLSGLVARDVTTPLVYIGSDISIDKLNATLTSRERYMIVLEPSETDGLSHVHVYTSFNSDRFNQYRITYPKYDTETSKELIGHTQLLNLQPLFTRVDFTDPWPGEHENQNVYALVEHQTGQYRVYVPSLGTGEPPDKRIPEPFEYKIDVEHDEPCYARNPKTVKIGLILVEGVPGPNIKSALVRLQAATPDYITLKNPHPYLMQTNNRHDPNWINLAFEQNTHQSEYWLADINMPLYHMHDYDVIIFAGQGTIELTTDQIEHFEVYLEHGGTIWLDNSGTTPDSGLNVDGLPVSIYFEHHEIHGELELPQNFLNILARYYQLDLSQLDEITNTYMVINGPQDGHIILKRIDEDAATPTNLPHVMIYDAIGGRGRIYATADGCMKGLVDQHKHKTELSVNSIFRLLEHQWLTTGLIKDAVLNSHSVNTADMKHGKLTLSYENGYDNNHNLIKLKRLVPKDIRRAVERYIPKLRSRQRRSVTQYMVDLLTDKVTLVPDKDTYNDGDILYVHTDENTQPWAVPYLSDVDVSYPQVEITYTIEAFTHEQDGPNLPYKPCRSLKDISHNKHEVNISAHDGLVHCGPRFTKLPLRTALPPYKSGTTWVDKALIYYQINIGQFVSGIWQPGSPYGNIFIYDTETDEYKICKDGTITISATDITDTQVILAETYRYETLITDYYAIYTEPAILQLHEPASIDQSAPWYVRVKNGHFLSKQTITHNSYGELDEGITALYNYRLPEYNRQPFSPPGQQETMYQALESSEFIDNNLIRVRRTPIIVDEDRPMSVVKRGKHVKYIQNEVLTPGPDNKVFQAEHGNWLRNPPPIIYGNIPDHINYATGTVTFTTPQSEITASYTYTTDIPLEVASYDRNSGLIQLQDNIEYTDLILASYYYQQDFLEYVGFDDGTTFWHLDLNPSPGHYITYYGEHGPADIETYKLLGETIYIYIIPYTDGEYVNDYVVRHTFSKDTWWVIQQANPQALLLGQVQVREASTPDQLVVIDTRSRGGGLRSHVTHNTMDKIASQHNLPSAKEHFWDIGLWGGDAYQQFGVGVVTLPKRIKHDQGGQFTEDDIIEIVRKQLSFGIVPILNYANTNTNSLAVETLIQAQKSDSLSATVTVE